MGVNENDYVSAGCLRVEPLTPENWDEFIRLFGEKGACGNCWCMYYRLGKTEYQNGTKSGGNKKAMTEIVRSGKPAGLLGFIGTRAVAWCAFAPREDFRRLEKSRIHKRIDSKAVWSIPCLFIDKNHRKTGLSAEMLKAAVRYARDKGIMILEAYPVVPANGKLPDAFAWSGVLKTFEQAGFRVVDRKSENHPMVRYYAERNT